jgi:anhydro-N-acetylmuramic acid kinase
MTVPWPVRLREELMALFGEDATVTQLCRLNVEAGQHFGAATLRLLEAANVEASDVAFIGSHGQTVRHLPPHTGLGENET